MYIVTREDHIRQLNYFARAFGDCIADVRDRRYGIPVYFNVDFSLLCPVLFERAPKESKEFLSSTKDGMRRVLDSAAAGNPYYKLVVSGATILEFFDQLDHLFRSLPELQLRLPMFRNRYSLRDKTLLRGQLRTSREIQHDLRELSILTTRGQDERWRAPIKRLLTLLDSKAVLGIGDVLDPKLLRSGTDTELFGRFVEQQIQRRQESDSRAPDDRLFHYKIDAANNCLTIAASKDTHVSAPFVTPTPLNVEQCTVGNKVYARLDRTPLFLTNLHRLKRSPSPQIGDEINFLNSAAREAVALLEELRGCVSLDECPLYTQVRLARFYKGPVALLERASRDDNAKAEDTQIEEIMKILSDPRRIQEIMKEAEQEIRQGARLVELHAARYDFPYLDELNFSNDPVIERIKKDLQVNFKQ